MYKSYSRRVDESTMSTPDLEAATNYAYELIRLNGCLSYDKLYDMMWDTSYATLSRAVADSRRANLVEYIKGKLCVTTVGRIIGESSLTLIQGRGLPSPEYYTI